MGRVMGKIVALTIVLLGLPNGSADAGTMYIYDRTSALIGQADLTLENIPGATEGYGPGDLPFLSSPYSDALEIYTMVDGHKLSIDGRPIDTSGWDFYLGVKGGPVTCDNFLKLEVTDSTDLSTLIYAYDTIDPLTKYQIPTDGSILTINLPNLVNQSAGEYAHWRLDLTPTPEPSTITLLGIGAGVMAFHWWRRRRYG
jgi:hypothetical protein